MHCKSCGFSFQVDARFAGRRGRCPLPECRHEFQIPARSRKEAVVEGGGEKPGRPSAIATKKSQRDAILVHEDSAAVAPVVEGLAASGATLAPRAEFYAISEDRHLPPLMQIERSAVPFFGIQASGVHMNGFVRRADGLHMWIARRASGKMTYPGMLDNMVAGGQPLGLGLKENMIKECAEEAGIPQEIARTVRAVGMIDYSHQSEDTAKPDRQYCYDLELPETFQPVAADGEVGEFMLWPIEKVAEVVRDTFEFKFNCNLVIIDFLIRHGVLDPDSEPDYAAICLGLRRSGAI